MKPEYLVIFPFVDDMGQIPSVVVRNKPMESKEQEALWHINKMREHDSIVPLKNLPVGTKFKEIYL